MASRFNDDELENLISGDRSSLPEEDDEEDLLKDGPAPASTIAGPQTQSDQVKQRIAAVRGGGAPEISGPSSAPSQDDSDNAPAFDLGPKPMGADPSQMGAAQQFAQKNALSAGIGRSLNALAAGTGYKPDNSEADAAEKQGQNAIAQAQTIGKSQQQAVKDWIAGKAKQAENTENRDFKERMLDQKDADRAALVNATSGKKGDDKYQKTYTDSANALEQMRGNPAVQQAERDLYSSDKVKSLVKQGGGDPNNLNPQFVKLLVSEVGKIAQGGSPTTHELEGLTPATLNGVLADVWQKFSNKPTPANAGAFIKQYQQYADTVSGDAQKLITDRYSRVLGPRKKLLHPDDYKTLEDTYVNRFKQSEPPVAEGAPSPKSPEMSGGFPKQIRKAGKMAMVSNQAELDEATAEGWQ